MVIILVGAVLATLALAGWIFYLLAKRYFENQQKQQLLQMKIDERSETLRVVTTLSAVAITGWILYLLVKRYFDNQQKERLLQMKIDERRLRAHGALP